MFPRFAGEVKRPAFVCFGTVVVASGKGPLWPTILGTLRAFEVLLAARLVLHAIGVLTSFTVIERGDGSVAAAECSSQWRARLACWAARKIGACLIGLERSSSSDRKAT
jgi:hypothetical protein